MVRGVVQEARVQAEKREALQAALQVQIAEKKARKERERLEEEQADRCAIVASSSNSRRRRSVCCCCWLVCSSSPFDCAHLSEAPAACCAAALSLSPACLSWWYEYVCRLWEAKAARDAAAPVMPSPVGRGRKGTTLVGGQGPGQAPSAAAAAGSNNNNNNPVSATANPAPGDPVVSPQHGRRAVVPPPSSVAPLSSNSVVSPTSELAYKEQWLAMQYPTRGGGDPAGWASRAESHAMARRGIDSVVSSASMEDDSVKILQQVL